MSLRLLLSLIRRKGRGALVTDKRAETNSAERVLITGGAGFIGANLVREFRQSSPDIELVVLDDLSTGYLENLDGMEVDFRLGSVADPEAIGSAADGVDAIVHLGALGSVPRSVADPIATHIANLDGTLQVLEAARRNDAHVVFSSSSSVYGANRHLPKNENDWTRPLSPYAVSKLGAESYALAYQSSYGLPVLPFRFFNVYGPLQSAGHAYAAVIPKFLDRIRDGEPVVIEGDGEQSRDFTSVRTVCAVIRDAVLRRVTSESPVNLAYGSMTTVNELADMIQDHYGAPVAREHVAARVGDVRASTADGVLVRELFPSIEPVPLAEALPETVDWYLRRPSASQP